MTADKWLEFVQIFCSILAVGIAGFAVVVIGSRLTKP